ncbi:MAG TPA: hypothetical protein VEO54_01515 [Thermoanaerobaculia bacterium]|nr:hypothetical protein [Thermoanaerobaculia bacterium]
MKKSTVAIAVVLGFLGVIGLAAAVVAFGYFAVKGVSSGPPTEAQKRLVLSAAAFDSYEVDLDPKCVQLTSKRNLDRTHEISFEHDCEGSDIYVSSGAEICPSVRDARESFVISVGAYRTGVAIGDAELQSRAALLPLGDERYAAIIRNNGKPVGNVFVVRQGRVLHSLLVTGLYFDKAEDVRELFTPLLAESKKQFP